MNLSNLLELEKCNCGRKQCDFFGAGIGEYGSSFSREEVEGMLKQLPKIQKHLKKILTHK